MNREQLQALVAAIEGIPPGCRREAVEYAMCIVAGYTSVEAVFGPAVKELNFASQDKGEF